MADPTIEALIDADLDIARTHLPAFLRANPPVAHQCMKAPGVENLYPNLWATPTPADWIRPILRRFANGELPAPHFSDMMALLLRKLRHVTADEFVALTEPRVELAKDRTVTYLYSMAVYLRHLESLGPLTQAVVEAAGKLLHVCSDDAHRQTFIWPCFRYGVPLDSTGACWSAGVRRDLDSLEPKQRALWLRMFNAHWAGFIGAVGKPNSACTAAVKKIGSAPLEAALHRWIGMLSEEPGPVFSPAGYIVFRHIIDVCALLEGSAGDQLLYEIASIPWPHGSDDRWLGDYQWALKHRSPDRAFACREALMMNPATSASREVREQYQAQLAVFGARAMPAAPLGVDGFPLDRDSALQPQQTRIDQLLRMAAGAVANGPHYIIDPPAPWFPVSSQVNAAFEQMEASILKEFSADPESLHRASTIRFDWIVAHHDEFSEDLLKIWNTTLRGLGCEGGLVQRSLQQAEQVSLESLLNALRTGAGHADKILELSQTHVAAHGWCEELVEALRQYIPKIGTGRWEQAKRNQIEWFLWFEDVAPIRLDECWSYRIKRDLRAMTPEDSAAWRALLANATLMVTAKPPGKWSKAAEPVFRKLRPDDFRRRFVEWFQPFTSAQPLRLSIAGRTVLRTLMWYALLAQDPAVDQALAGYASVKWKTKEFLRRANQAEMAFSYVLSERAPEVALPILEKLVASGQAFAGGDTHRVYQELCARSNRMPVAAIPQGVLKNTDLTDFVLQPALRKAKAVIEEAERIQPTDKDLAPNPVPDARNVIDRQPIGTARD